MPARFTDKVVCITGASAGIGAAAARRFAAEGAKVVLSARGAERLEAVVAEIRAAGGEAHGVVGDVGVDADAERLLDEAVAAFGGLDVLVNNAGLHHRGPVRDRSAAELADMVHVNLRAPVLLTRLALPLLEARGGGRGVQVASLARRVPTPGGAPYSASKFGLRAFSFALNDELAGTGITVSVVSPGPVDTGFIMGDVDEVSDLTFSQPISTAAQVADAILACAHDGKRERTLPAKSRVLTTSAYLMPWLGRALRPALEAKGRRVKARLRREG